MAYDPATSLFGLTSQSHMIKPGTPAAGIVGPQAAAGADPFRRPSSLETAFFTKAQMDELKLSPLAEALNGSEAASKLFDQLDPKARAHLADLVSTKLLSVDDVVKGLRGLAKEAVMTRDTILVEDDAADMVIGYLEQSGSAKDLDASGTGQTQTQRVQSDIANESYWQARAEGIKSLNALNLFADEEDSELTSAKDMAAVKKLTHYLKHPPDMERYFQQARKAYLQEQEDWSEEVPEGFTAITFNPAVQYGKLVLNRSQPYESELPLALGSAATFLKEIEAVTRALQERMGKDPIFQRVIPDKE